MTVAITQTCDGCGLVRAVPTDILEQDVRSIRRTLVRGDWVEVLGSKHLCCTCIKNALH